MSSYSCPNYGFDDDTCRRLGTPCRPCQPGCVLAGKAEVIAPPPVKKMRRPARKPRPAGT